jgi:hypothetical protein
MFFRESPTTRIAVAVRTNISVRFDSARDWNHMASIPTLEQRVVPERRIPRTALCKLFTFEQIRLFQKTRITILRRGRPGWRSIAL